MTKAELLLYLDEKLQDATKEFDNARNALIKNPSENQLTLFYHMSAWHIANELFKVWDENLQPIKDAVYEAHLVIRVMQMPDVYDERYVTKNDVTAQIKQQSYVQIILDEIENYLIDIGAMTEPVTINPVDVEQYKEQHLPIFVAQQKYAYKIKETEEKLNNADKSLSRYERKRLKKMAKKERAQARAEIQTVVQNYQQ